MQQLHSLDCTFRFYSCTNFDQLHTKICPAGNAPSEEVIGHWTPMGCVSSDRYDMILFEYTWLLLGCYITAVCIFVCLCICLSVCLPLYEKLVCSAVCVAICLSIPFSVSLLICLYVYYLSLHPSIHIYFCLFASVWEEYKMFVWLPVSLSLFLSTYPSVCMSTLVWKDCHPNTFLCLSGQNAQFPSGLLLKGLGLWVR